MLSKLRFLSNIFHLPLRFIEIMSYLRCYFVQVQIIS